MLWRFHVKFLQLHVPRRRLRPAPAASFKEDFLVELLKLRLAKDPERSELKIEELEMEMEMEVGLDRCMGLCFCWLMNFDDLCLSWFWFVYFGNGRTWLHV